MPTILVADDNSNIQKMVTLAVKELGVVVVAVGNGEAAVRKVSELRPDLVLADIFMPLRTGYEVCEFVKKDSRFSHIPVVLLAGAFDPFDEREAQRVGADGVLKKPFVPPDPLLALVKTLLDRAPVPVPAPVAASSLTSPAPEPPAPPVAAAQVIEMPPPTPAEEEKEDELPQEEPHEEYLAARPGVFEEEEKPFATGGLPTDSGAIATPVPEAPAGEEEPGLHTWKQPSGVDTSYAEAEGEQEPARYWEKGAPSLSRREEAGFLRDTDIEKESAAAPAAEPQAAEKTAPEPAPNPVAAEPPPVSSLPALASTVPDPPPLWEDTADTLVVPANLVRTIAEDRAAEPERAIETQHARIRQEPTSPSPAAETLPEPPSAVEPSPHISPAVTAPSSALLAAAETAVLEALPGAKAVQPPPEFPPHPEAPSVAPAFRPGQVRSYGVPTPPDPALVDAIVGTVLERMQPQILDIVTREILRPVIEALVRREFDKKQGR